jgi:hypothetical protein
LRLWLEDWPGTEPLDRFLAYLFSDLLSDAKFRPEPDLQAAAVCDWLVRTAKRFRRAAPALNLIEFSQQAQVFVNSVYQGIVTGTPLPEVQVQSNGAGQVTIATLYAYLLTGTAVDYQVWLETGATGWWEIPRQPLSNAFVLSPTWEPSQLWTEADAFAVRNQLLSRLVRGLCARCGRGLILASSDLDRRGVRQEGPLWRALLPLL